MLDGVFLTVHGWLTAGSAAALLGSFLWGAVSVLFSPCHLASIPLIIGYVGGQRHLVEGRQAAFYASLFTVGLFTTIAIIGIVTSLLGRLLGDVGPWWSILVGLVLMWVALDMLGVSRCSLSGGLMGRIRLHGPWGALALGLAYGIVSGSCTFGFLAPILAVVSVQEQFARGLALIVLFGIGHCLPIALAGSSTAWVKRLLARSDFQTASLRFRRAAGVLIAVLSLYFLAQPFIA